MEVGNLVMCTSGGEGQKFKIGVWNSFSFWPESVSYERSRLIRRCILREISARVFFGKKYKIKKKTYFQYFQDIGKIEKSIFQYFQD